MGGELGPYRPSVSKTTIRADKEEKKKAEMEAWSSQRKREETNKAMKKDEPREERKVNHRST